MKGKVLFGVFLLLVVLLLAGAGCQQKEQSVTVLNPAIPTPMVERVPLAPRTGGSLDGKTIYLVDLQWGGPEAGYSVFEEMQKWFAKNMPSVKVELRRASGGWMGNDPALQKEIIEKKAAGVVIGIGG
jgi:hypothetical protein